MALNKTQRGAMLRQELDGDDVDVPTPETYVADPGPRNPEPPAAPAVAAAPAVPALSFDQLIALFQAATANKGGDIGEQISEAIRSNRQPIPEIPFNEYPAVSHFHPGGKDVPRPDLRAKFWLGVWDDQAGRAIPVFPLDARQLRDDEITALNDVQSGVWTMARNDGTVVMARVVEIENVFGTLERVVLAFPPHVFSKEHKNSLPPIVTMARQFSATTAAA